MASPPPSVPPSPLSFYASRATCVWRRVLLCMWCCWWFSWHCRYIQTNRSFWALCWWSQCCGDWARPWTRRASAVSDSSGRRGRYTHPTLTLSTHDASACVPLSVCVSCARDAVCWGKRTPGLCLHHLSLVAGHCHLHSLPLVQPADEGMTLCMYVCVVRNHLMCVKPLQTHAPFWIHIRKICLVFNLSPIFGPCPTRPNSPSFWPLCCWHATVIGWWSIGLPIEWITDSLASLGHGTR